MSLTKIATGLLFTCLTQNVNASDNKIIPDPHPGRVKEGEITAEQIENKEWCEKNRKLVEHLTYLAVNARELTDQQHDLLTEYYNRSSS